MRKDFGGKKVISKKNYAVSRAESEALHAFAMMGKKREVFQISHECVIDSLSSDETQKGRARVSAGAKIVW